MPASSQLTMRTLSIIHMRSPALTTLFNFHWHQSLLAKPNLQLLVVVDVPFPIMEEGRGITILTQELYFLARSYSLPGTILPPKKCKLENMQQPVLAQELYFPKRKFRLENCTNQQQKTVSINSSYHRQFKVINSAKIETAINCKKLFFDMQF